MDKFLLTDRKNLIIIIRSLDNDCDDLYFIAFMHAHTYLQADNHMEKYFLAALQMVSGIGAVISERLLDYFGSAENAWKASEDEVITSKILSAPLYNKFFRHRRTFSVEKNAEEWSKRKIQLLSIFDEDYPALLKNIYNPPIVLFYKGKLYQKQKHLAIVGSRKFSVYGKSVAERLAADLAAQGFVIVSGAARGIDTFSHRGALRTGSTIAVLGCGVDIAYPRENARLLAQIAENGAVISEYAPNTQPLAAFFPARNRIISGLCQGTIVVEAAKRSGSLITAEMALSEGRDVFAVPGSIYSDQSIGCNHLIQQGAKLIVCAQDVAEEYDFSNKDKKQPGNSQDMPVMSDEEKKVYDILFFDQALSVDEIIYKLRTDVSNISFVLLQMKLKNIIEETLPGMYVRATKGRLH